MRVISLVSDLHTLIPDPERVSTAQSILEQHSHDFSYHPARLPGAVVFPIDTAEVAGIVRYAHDHGVSVIPFGQGTGIEGHIIPVRETITLDTSRMNRITALQPDDFVVRVQPGLTRLELNRALGPHGLFFPVDPGANASIGGMVATNAAGTESLRYGSMRTQVLGLEAVLANGQIIHTGGTVMKSSAGYPLSSLFVGSEGTLAVFTEITLKIYGIPEFTVAARANFPTVEDAGQAAHALIMQGLALNRVELLDEQTLAAINEVEGTDFPLRTTLFVELAGNHRSALLEDLQTAADAVQQSHGADWRVEWQAEDRQHLWLARHHAALDILAASHGTHPFTTDTAVPLSQLPQALRHARQTLNELGMEGAVLGHVGDGNYHIVMGINPQDPGQLERAKAVNAAVIHYALAHGGTCTGEHGIGMGKRAFLQEERQDAAGVLRRIKEALDPNGVLNPGKTIPPRESDPLPS